MKTNIRVLLVLAVALIATGVVIRQEREVGRLRAAIAELKSLPTEGVGISTVTNLLLADIEELRREVAEIPG